MSAGRPKGSLKGRYPTKEIVNGKLRSTKEYSAWVSMRARCLDEMHPLYRWYGERGIKVCSRWQESFDNFMDDMNYAPTGTGLGRKDVNGDYTPENCRWMTKVELLAGRRTGKGTPHIPGCLRQRALQAGQPYHRVYNRIHQLGWSERQALRVPKLKAGAQFGHPNYMNGTHKRKTPVISNAAAEVAAICEAERAKEKLAKMLPPLPEKLETT